MPSQCRSKLCPEAFLLAISICISEIIAILALSMFYLYCPLLTIASALLACVARSVFSGLEKHTATLACGLVMAFSALYYNPIAFVSFALGASRPCSYEDLGILGYIVMLCAPLSYMLGFMIASRFEGLLYQDVKHESDGDSYLRTYQDVRNVLDGASYLRTCQDVPNDRYGDSYLRTYQDVRNVLDGGSYLKSINVRINMRTVVTWS